MSGNTFGRLFTVTTFGESHGPALGAIDDARPGHVAMLLENHLELLALFGGCGVAGLTLFGVNNGLRGHGFGRSLILPWNGPHLPKHGSAIITQNC